VDRRIVLVSGPPGAGKTTLARPLAKALGFALLSKDDIKEPLYDALAGVAVDPEASRRIGAASWAVLWVLAPHVPRLVLESNFRWRSDYEQQKLRALEGRVVEVYCRCPPSEVARRFAERAAAWPPSRALW
jgi:predicted kinase